MYNYVGVGKCVWMYEVDVYSCGEWLYVNNYMLWFMFNECV